MIVIPGVPGIRIPAVYFRLRGVVAADLWHRKRCMSETAYNIHKEGAPLRARKNATTATRVNFQGGRKKRPIIWFN